MALVGSGCEKAKHHLNPSPKRPKTLRNRKQKTGETLPTEPSKDKKKIASSTTNLQAAGRHVPKQVGPSKNHRARRQKTRNTQTSPLDHTMTEIAKRHKNARNVTFGALETSPLERSTERDSKILETSPLERSTERDSKALRLEDQTSPFEAF